MQMVVICNSIAVQQAEPGLSGHVLRKSRACPTSVVFLSFRLFNSAAAETAFDQNITTASPD